MAAMDMKLEELEKYTGRWPMPADFDSFWDNTLKELAATEANVKLEPAQFQVPFADCFDLTFTGLGGARVYAKYLRPKKISTPAPAIVQFHGYSGSGGDWNDKLNWVAAGFCIAALDCRGQAGKSEDNLKTAGNSLRGHIIRGLVEGRENLYFRHVFCDTARLAQIVMAFDEVDENRVGAMGGSQGGALALACAALEPRVKQVHSVFPFLSDYKRVWDMDMCERAYEEMKIYFRNFDPNHVKEKYFFDTLAYIDVKNLAHRIKGETRMSISLMDNVCPPSTQFAAFNNIIAKKESLYFYDFGHEGLPGSADWGYQFMMKMLK